jgi:hypothetical protein
MKAKKEKEEEASDIYCSLKVPIDHEDKESKTYTVKVKRYDLAPPRIVSEVASYLGRTSLKQWLWRKC